MNYPYANRSTAAALSGIGLHSGTASSVHAERREEDGMGLRFVWPGWKSPLRAADLAALKRGARRATELRGEGGEAFRTPEHLLAAALFFADAPLDVFCDAGEPPGGDGSALPFHELLARAAPEKTDPPRIAEYPSALEWDYDGPEGTLSARPAAAFSVEYVLDSPPQHFLLESAADAPVEILPARTFILYRDWVALSGRDDLLSGARADSGLLLAESPAEFAEAKQRLPDTRGTEFPRIHPASFRFENEPARHKILDLMGDLALLGLALPRLRLRIRNGGHALNHLLLERLHHERRNA